MNDATGQAATGTLEWLRSQTPPERQTTLERLAEQGRAQDIPFLVASLQDENPDVQRTAIAGLVQVGALTFEDNSVVPALAELAKAGPEPITCLAVDALAALDGEGNSVPVLIELAQSPSTHLRKALIKTLVNIEERTGVEIWTRLERDPWLDWLTEALGEDDAENRLAALKALGYLGDPSTTDAILGAYRRLSAPSEEETEATIVSLIGTANTDTLVSAIADPDEKIAQVVGRALGILRAPEAVPALSTMATDHPSWELRKLALASLFMVGTEEAKASIPKGLDDSSGYVRCEAVRLLATSARSRDVRMLVDRLGTESYGEVREEIVRGLGRLASREVWTEVMSLARTGPPAARTSAVRAIGLAKLPQGLDALVPAVKDPEWEVRRAAVEGLGRYSDDQVLETIMSAMSDEHEKVRLAATIALTRWETPEAMRALLEHALNDSHVWVRYRAVERLGSHKLAEAMEPLIAIATNGQEPTLLRRAAIIALGGLEGTRAKATLESLLAGEEGVLKSVAEEALRPPTP